MLYNRRDWEFKRMDLQSNTGGDKVHQNYVSTKSQEGRVCQVQLNATEACLVTLTLSSLFVCNEGRGHPVEIHRDSSSTSSKSFRAVQTVLFSQESVQYCQLSFQTYLLGQIWQYVKMLLLL